MASVNARNISPGRAPTRDAAAVPHALDVVAAGWPALEGRYVRGGEVRGYPAWYYGTDCVIFTDTYGAWAITDGGAESVANSEACVAAGDGTLHVHHGTPPHRMIVWMEFCPDTSRWMRNAGIAVTEAAPGSMPPAPHAPQQPPADTTRALKTTDWRQYGSTPAAHAPQARSHPPGPSQARTHVSVKTATAPGQSQGAAPAASTGWGGAPAQAQPQALVHISVVDNGVVGNGAGGGAAPAPAVPHGPVLVHRSAMAPSEERAASSVRGASLSSSRREELMQINAAKDAEIERLRLEVESLRRHSTVTPSQHAQAHSAAHHAFTPVEEATVGGAAPPDCVSNGPQSDLQSLDRTRLQPPCPFPTQNRQPCTPLGNMSLSAWGEAPLLPADHAYSDVHAKHAQASAAATTVAPQEASQVKSLGHGFPSAVSCDVGGAAASAPLDTSRQDTQHTAVPHAPSQVHTSVADAPPKSALEFDVLSVDPSRARAAQQSTHSAMQSQGAASQSQYESVLNDAAPAQPFSVASAGYPPASAPSRGGAVSNHSSAAPQDMVSHAQLWGPESMVSAGVASASLAMNVAKPGTPVSVHAAGEDGAYTTEQHVQGHVSAVSAGTASVSQGMNIPSVVKSGTEAQSVPVSPPQEMVSVPVSQAASVPTTMYMSGTPARQSQAAMSQASNTPVHVQQRQSTNGADYASHPASQAASAPGPMSVSAMPASGGGVPASPASQGISVGGDALSLKSGTPMSFASGAQQDLQFHGMSSVASAGPGYASASHATPAAIPSVVKSVSRAHDSVPEAPPQQPASAGVASQGASIGHAAATPAPSSHPLSPVLRDPGVHHPASTGQPRPSVPSQGHSQMSVASAPGVSGVASMQASPASQGMSIGNAVHSAMPMSAPIPSQGAQVPSQQHAVASAAPSQGHTSGSISNALSLQSGTPMLHAHSGATTNTPPDAMPLQPPSHAMSIGNAVKTPAVHTEQSTQQSSQPASQLMSQPMSQSLGGGSLAQRQALSMGSVASQGGSIGNAVRTPALSAHQEHVLPPPEHMPDDTQPLVPAGVLALHSQGMSVGVPTFASAPHSAQQPMLSDRQGVATPDSAVPVGSAAHPVRSLPGSTSAVSGAHPTSPPMPAAHTPSDVPLSAVAASAEGTSTLPPNFRSVNMQPGPHSGSGSGIPFDYNAARLASNPSSQPAPVGPPLYPTPAHDPHSGQACAPPSMQLQAASSPMQAPRSAGSAREYPFRASEALVESAGIDEARRATSPTAQMVASGAGGATPAPPVRSSAFTETAGVHGFRQQQPPRSGRMSTSLAAPGSASAAQRTGGVTATAFAPTTRSTMLHGAPTPMPTMEPVPSAPLASGPTVITPAAVRSAVLAAAAASSAVQALRDPAGAPAVPQPTHFGAFARTRSPLTPPAPVRPAAHRQLPAFGAVASVPPRPHPSAAAVAAAAATAAAPTNAAAETLRRIAPARAARGVSPPAPKAAPAPAPVREPQVFPQPLRSEGMRALQSQPASVLSSGLGEGAHGPQQQQRAHYRQPPPPARTSPTPPEDVAPQPRPTPATATATVSELPSPAEEPLRDTAPTASGASHSVTEAAQEAPKSGGSVAAGADTDTSLSHTVKADAAPEDPARAPAGEEDAANDKSLLAGITFFRIWKIGEGRPVHLKAPRAQKLKSLFLSRGLRDYKATAEERGLVLTHPHLGDLAWDASPQQLGLEGTTAAPVEVRFAAPGGVGGGGASQRGRPATVNFDVDGGGEAPQALTPRGGARGVRPVDPTGGGVPLSSRGRSPGRSPTWHLRKRFSSPRSSSPAGSPKSQPGVPGAPSIKDPPSDPRAYHKMPAPPSDGASVSPRVHVPLLPDMASPPLGAAASPPASPRAVSVRPAAVPKSERDYWDATHTPTPAMSPTTAARQADAQPRPQRSHSGKAAKGLGGSVKGLPAHPAHAHGGYPRAPLLSDAGGVRSPSLASRPSLRTSRSPQLARGGAKSPSLPSSAAGQRRGSKRV